MKSVFEFRDYRPYLMQRFGGDGRRTGDRSKAARAMDCHSTFVSHVLQGKVNLSLEQGDKLNDFFGHAEHEAHFFLLLLQKERAGTQKLRKYFEKQIERISEERAILSRRVPENQSISKEDEAAFYSSWLYGAAHVLISIPALQLKENLAAYLQIPLGKVTEILEFLVSLGLAENENGRYKMGASHVHLSDSSHHIGKHHTNWRMQAIRSLDLKKPEDLHYSAVVTLSKADAALIRNRLLSSLQENLETIRDSREEEGYVYCLDFFPLSRGR
jgi:uncharacterized protein (TIGR02147 family)